VELKRFQLEGHSIAELQARVIAEHGPGARIVAAEKVTVGGIRGFFARQHVEVTVEIRAADAPAVGTRRGRRAHARLDTQARLGIAALLDDAEEAEARVNGRSVSVAGPVSAGSGSGYDASGLAPMASSTSLSTGSGDFAALMDDLTFNTTPALSASKMLESAPDPQSSDPQSSAPQSSAPQSSVPQLSAPRLFAVAPRSTTASSTPGPDVPRPLSGAGDLVIIIGLRDDALTVAESMASGGAGSSGAPGDVALAGALAPGYDPAWDRRRAIGARARGVERSQSLFIAFGLGSGTTFPSAGGGAISGSGRSRTEGHLRFADDGTRGDVVAYADAVRAIGADQVWVAVDAGRKPDDTARWVNALAETMPIDAVAVVGSETTSSPETVNTLAIPVGWVDGHLQVSAVSRAAGATISQARLV
jgi:hypothetical protein